MLFLNCLVLFGGEYHYMNGGKRIELEPLAYEGIRLRGQEVKMLCFTDPDSRKLCVGRQLIVKFKSLEHFDQYIESYDLRILKKYDFGNMFLLEASSPYAAMDAANALYRMPDIEYAQPDMTRERKLR